MNYYTEKEKLIRFKNQTKNLFFSIVRNFNNFENTTNEDIIKSDEIANKIHKNIEKTNNNDILFYTMSYINRELRKYEDKDFLVLILIRTIDPELKLYKIYEEECRKKQIRLRSLIEVGVYEPNLIKYEKAYINKFCDMDDYDFTKKYVF